MTPAKPVILCILDGWGAAAPGPNNAIFAAHTPNYDRWRQTYPQAFLQTSALEVGLPEGQMGNSEVGHQNIGAGRVVMQDLPRIDAAVDNGTIADNPVLRMVIDKLRASQGACHLLGLLSPGGVHAHQRHILALAKALDTAGIPVKIHAFLDGRDTPPASAKDYVAACAAAIADHPGIEIASLCGRYFAMDRDKRWQRVAQAYDLLVTAGGRRHQDQGAATSLAEAALQAAYAADETDEFVKPTALGDYQGMADGDGVIMCNFRADRAREIMTGLLDPDFDGFKREKTIRFAATAGMTAYAAALEPFLPAMFAPEILRNTLGEVVAQAGKKQLRIAETEKYAHVTFFLNGGQETCFEGEERILVPSPNVATYDLKPEMSAYELTDDLAAAIRGQQFDLIVVNYANPDMVGHTGNLAAAKAAVEVVDQCLGRLEQALHEVGGAMLVTADHGNIETMVDPQTGEAHTAHTTNPVPLFLLGAQSEQGLRDGRLADLAPTILQLMELPIPQEMSGQTLLVPKSIFRNDRDFPQSAVN